MEEKARMEHYRSAKSRSYSGRVSILDNEVISLAYCVLLTRLTVYTSGPFPKKKDEELYLDLTLSVVLYL